MDSLITRVIDYATKVQAVADAEVCKLRHDPTELLTRAILPAIWLVLFGEVMAQVRGLGGRQGIAESGGGLAEAGIPGGGAIP